MADKSQTKIVLGEKDIPDNAYWGSTERHFLAYRIDGTELGDSLRSIYVAYNGWSGAITITLPAPSAGRAWYRAGEKRYDYLYSEEELAEWVFGTEKHADGLQDALFLFNNCHRGQAIDNAHQLRGLIRRLEPQFDVVEPFGVPERQRSG